MIHTLTSTLHSLLHLITPQRCVLCDEINASAQICDQCAHIELTPHDMQFRCVRCFAPLLECNRCDTCSAQEHTFFQSRTLWDFTPAVRDLIHEMKYKGNSSLCYSTAYEFAPYLLEYFLHSSWDLIVPVPLHSSRITERGYNQCDYLCHGIVRALYSRSLTRLERTVLKRTRATEKQSLLSAKKRRTNLKGAFVCQKDLREKKILLVDDVYTTGATVESAALALSKAGATHIDLFTLARSDGGTG